MDRLEAVEISWLSVNKQESIRIDSEHYQKKYLSLLNEYANLEIELSPISKLIKKPVMTGHTPSMKNENFYSGKVNFIKTDNLRENMIQDDFEHYLSEEGNNKIKRSSLKKNDVIVTIIGATYKIIGRACLITEEILPANINQNIALIRVDLEKILPSYLNIYLNSRYGRLFLHYLSRQTEQVNLNCREDEQVQVPIVSINFQNTVKEIVTLINKLRQTSIEIDRQAEELLLLELGLNDWQPTEENIAVKSFAESFGKSDRLDAEHYQPKFDRLIQKLEKRVKLTRLGTLLNTCQKGKQPQYFGEDKEIIDGYPVINSKQVQKGEVILTDSRFAPIPDGKEPLVIQNDDVLINGTGVGTIWKMRYLPL